MTDARITMVIVVVIGMHAGCNRFGRQPVRSGGFCKFHGHSVDARVVLMMMERSAELIKHQNHH